MIGSGKNKIEMITYLVITVLMTSSTVYGETWTEIYSHYKGMMNSWDTALLLIFFLVLIFMGPILLIRSIKLSLNVKKNNEENIIDILKERLSIGKKEYSKFHDKNE